MSAGNISAGPRRKAWRAMTDFQRAQAGRLTLTALAAALDGSKFGVAGALRQAGAISPAVEEHVLWAAKRLTGELRLTVDPDGSASRYLHEGEVVRGHELATTTTEGLFS